MGMGLGLGMGLRWFGLGSAGFSPFDFSHSSSGPKSESDKLAETYRPRSFGGAV